MPLGRLESLEDPRLVRVGNYEAGATGRHDAAKVLTPFIDTFIARERSVQRVAVVLSETRSLNKIVQTLLEMVRGLPRYRWPRRWAECCQPSGEARGAFLARSDVSTP